MKIWWVCITVLILWVAAESFAQTDAAKCEPQSDLIIQEIHFPGSPSVGSGEAQAIASSLIGVCFSRNDGRNSLRERLRDAFQTHGFFSARIADLRLDVKNSLQRPNPVAVYAAIEAGPRYRVGEISFTNAKAVTSLDVLRRQIPLTPGDVFDIEKMREGIRNLRDFYGALGYVNFTPVPDTHIDESKQTVDVSLDLDEGLQFFVGHVEIIAPAEIAERLVESWPLKVSDVYSTRLVSWFFETNKDLLPAGATPQEDIQLTQDNSRGTVAIRVDLCPPGRVCLAQAVPCRSDRVCPLK